jgi:nicotinate-nucleotide pyrophosphorylase (carboxylating)
MEQAEEAIVAGAHIVMLDNRTPQELGVMAAQLKKRHPHIILEASGGTREPTGSKSDCLMFAVGVTIATLPKYMDSNVDVISLGSLTQGVPHIDFSLKIQH